MWIPLALMSAGLLTGPSQETVLLSDLVERTGRYAEAYEATLGAVIADEHYEQVEIVAGVPQKRIMESYFMLVFTDAEARWRGFRSIRSINGKDVDDVEHIRRLFNPDGSVDQDRLVKETARWNLGYGIYRSINIPTLPLLFLRSENRSRFDFKLEGAAERQGVMALGLHFKEKKHPTLIRNVWRMQSDVISLGTYWVEPKSGVIVATDYIAYDPETGGEGRINVVYSHDSELGLWVPAQMTETYTSRPVVDPLNVIRCTATYTRFRRYQVETWETYRLPQEQSTP